MGLIVDVTVDPQKRLRKLPSVPLKGLTAS